MHCMQMCTQKLGRTLSFLNLLYLTHSFTLSNLLNWLQDYLVQNVVKHYYPSHSSRQQERGTDPNHLLVVGQ